MISWLANRKRHRLQRQLADLKRQLGDAEERLGLIERMPEADLRESMAFNEGAYRDDIMFAIERLEYNLENREAAAPSDPPAR